MGVKCRRRRLSPIGPPFSSILRSHTPEGSGDACALSISHSCGTSSSFSFVIVAQNFELRTSTAAGRLGSAYHCDCGATSTTALVVSLFAFGLFLDLSLSDGVEEFGPETLISGPSFPGKACRIAQLHHHFGIGTISNSALSHLPRHSTVQP